MKGYSDVKSFLEGKKRKKKEGYAKDKIKIKVCVNI
jgi:hypothetical protein